MCWKCVGEGRDCKTCNSARGHTKEKKPPLELINRNSLALFKYYTFLKNYNIWPIEGGLSEQPAIFIKVIEYCDLVISKFNEIEAERETEKAKITAKQHGQKQHR